MNNPWKVQTLILLFGVNIQVLNVNIYWMQLDTLLRESWIIWNKRTVKLIIQTFFPFSASIDTVSFLIATTVLLSALVVALVVAYSLYKLKRMSSRQTAERNNAVSEVITVDSKYETLQRKKVTGEVDTHTPGEYMEIDRVNATEYMEISAINSDDIDLNMK